MTPEEQAKKIQDFIAKFDTLVSDTFEKATENLATDIHHRVFDLHEDIEGGKLGQYSTTPTLIGAKSFANQSNANAFFSKEKAARKKANGEKQDSNWRTIGDKHLYLLEGGYKELRNIQGRPTGEIDLQYTFELATSGIKTDFSNGYQVKFSNQKATDKGRGFEQRRGKKVFYNSQAEGKKALDYINEKIMGGLKECFS